MRFMVGTRAADSVDAAKRLAHDLSESGLDGRLLETGLLSTNFWEKRYEVRGLISPGSRGAVLDVYDHTQGAHRAAKVVDLARRRDFDEELLRKEAAVLKRVHHPLIPRLVDVLYDDDVGVAVLVQQRFLGVTLDSTVRQNGPIAPEHVGWIMADALNALGTLHTAGLVHRDIRPATLILGVDAAVRLLDVGRVGITRTNGTYVAPELRDGLRSFRSDLYSLALSLVAVVAGREADELPRRGATIDVDAAVPSLVRSTRVLLQRMAAFDPRERPANAAEARAALGTHGSAPRPRPVPVEHTPPQQPAPPPAKQPKGAFDARPTSTGTPHFARAKATNELVIDLRKLEWRSVGRVSYDVRPGWNPDFEVLYLARDGTHIDSEFLKPWHDTFAQWWRARGGKAPAPRSAEDALARIRELTRRPAQVALLVGGGSQRLRAIDLGGDVVEAVTGAPLELKG